MVKAIYLCSLKERVGKTLLSIGIMQKLQNLGKSVAYFKPIGIPKGAFSSKADIDVGFIQSIVIKSYKPYDIISPISIPDSYYIDSIDASKKEDSLAQINNAYKEVSKDVDFVVIEGAPSIRKYVRVGLDDLSIACELGIDELIFIETESSDRCIDDIFFTLKYFQFREMKIKGVIFNKIDYEYIARIQELRKDHIQRYNIDIIGIIEKSIELLSARVSEVQAAIGGELLNEGAKDGLANMVETYLIGAMNPQAALKYLRQVKRAAFITGGDRTDLALAALGEDTSCLILTGFIQPDLSVITAANEKGIPILLSPSDTYTTIRNMEKLKPGIQKDEIDKVLGLIDESVNWDLLFE